MSTSIWPYNIGISKLTCTLKEFVPPEWLLDEDVFPVGIHRRIYAKLSIIAFLCHLSDFLSNILKVSSTPSSLFSSTMGGRQVCEACLAKVKLVQALTPYTQLLHSNLSPCLTILVTPLPHFGGLIPGPVKSDTTWKHLHQIPLSIDFTCP